MGRDESPPPRVSVVIPTFNRAAFLPSAVRSALEQTLREIEVIIVDDGSTDATPEVCRLLAASDPRVRFVRQDNRRLSAARNTGLTGARTHWVAFLDDDDLWHPDFLSEMFAFVQRHGLQTAACLAVQFSAPAAFGDALEVLAEPGRFSVAPWPPLPPSGGAIRVAELLKRPLAPPNAALLSVDLVRRLGALDESLSSVGDYDLWLRMAHSEPIPVLEKVLALYRVHPSRLTSSLGLMAQQTRIVLERFIAMHPESVRLVGRRTLARRLSRLCREEAYAALLAADRGAAARAAWQSVAWAPAQVKGWMYLAAAAAPGAYLAGRRLRHRRR